MKKIFISAGDPSGEIHAARLMKQIKEQYGEVEFTGLGGENMIREGLLPLARLSDISVVGFWEVAKRYGFFRSLLNKCRNVINKETDIFIPVDYPGFNIRLAGYAKKAGIPVAYYIAPQLWAWGKNRAKKLSAVVDKLLVVFPFEVDYFRDFGIDAVFTGHPLMDDPVFADDPPGFTDREKLIALLPGSRDQEVKSHLPVLKKCADKIRSTLPEYDFGIGVSRTVDKRLYDDFITNNEGFSLFENTRKMMLQSRAGIVKTGTSTLEAALCGMPFAMFYKTSLLTYYMGRYLVNLPHISLVNIIRGEAAVKEFVQNDFRPSIVAEEISRIVKNEDYRKNMLSNFKSIREELGGDGASKKAAEEILKLIE